MHGDGAQFVMLPEREIMASCDNSTWFQMKPGQFKVQADQIALIGPVVVGSPTAGTPLALQASLTALEAWAANHTHLVPGVTSGTAETTSLVPTEPPTPSLGATRVLGV